MVARPVPKPERRSVGVILFSGDPASALCSHRLCSGSGFRAVDSLFSKHPRPLALEYDGGHHRENLTGDNRRQNRLVDAGYRLLRFTAADVLSAPESIVTLVRRALSSAVIDCAADRL